MTECIYLLKLEASIVQRVRGRRTTAVGRGSIAGALYLCPSISELIRFPICVPFVSILIAPTSAALSLVEPQLLGLWSSPLIGPRS